MSRFQPITMKWAGQEYVIAPKQVMGAIATIEEKITLIELYEALAKSRPPLSRIAQAYSAVLMYAGAKNVLDEDVYAGMFGTEGAPAQQAITSAIVTLLAMMQPPAALADKAVKTEGKKQPAAGKASKPPSKPRSAKKGGASAPANSGTSIQ